MSWTTGQVAKQRSLSVRTLRYYDQIGLLRPSFKDEHGKRYYSEEDLFRLEKILLLREIGLPLEEIEQVLENVSYREVLIAHHNHLQDQLVTLQKQLANTTSLINMVDMEDHLPWNKVSALVSQAKTIPKKWVDYFREEERAFLQKALPRLEENNPITQKYSSLLRRMEWCLSHGVAPQSEEGMEIAKKLIALSLETFGEDQELIDKFWQIRKLPVEETGLFPVSEEVLRFVEESIAAVEQHKNKAPAANNN